MRTPTSIVLTFLLAVACDGGSPSDVPSDPRCESACAETEPACGAVEASCANECSARVAGLSALCSSCLLDGAGRSGTICLEPPCCGSASLEYGSGPLECEASCEGELGRPPSDPDARCLAICPDDDAACGDDVASCRAACQARIAGANGLCATCLLEGAGAAGDICVEEPCCYGDPVFPRSVEECASLCRR